MASKAHTRPKSKKSAVAGAKAHDRQLLEKAAAESGEGGSREKGIPIATIPVDELESVCRQLKELTHVVVDAWATRDGYADGLEDVLVKLHAARRNLESTAEVQS